MKGSLYIDGLAAAGEFCFTTGALAQKLSISLVAALAIIRRLRAQGAVATPYKGFHLIVPPEYRALGCLPPEQFIHDLMAHLKIPYYVALLSAAQFYGAAHQKPQVFQVMIPENRVNIQCGHINISFVARRCMNALPAQPFKTPKGYVNVSTRELTALDIVNYPLRSGGLNNVVTVLEELVEGIDSQALENLIKKIETTSQLQRLGFFLDAIKSRDLAQIVANELAGRWSKPILLASRVKTQKTDIIHPRWKVIVNENWESDL